MSLNIGKAIEEVLACPICNSDLLLKNTEIVCQVCAQKYPIFEGIPDFLLKNEEQENERQFRDSIDYGGLHSDEEILSVVKNHHSVPLMIKKASSFLQRFIQDSYVLDIGIGFGWHWRATNLRKCNIVGIDFSLLNLKIASRYLRPEDNVLLLRADATRLPLKKHVIRGVWSVQVFQHFPPTVYRSVLNELDRVLTKDRYFIEVIDLNPALFLRLYLKLKSKHLHIQGKVGDMVLNRRNRKELGEVWSQFPRKFRQSFSYSENLYHAPYLRIQGLPVLLDSILSSLPSAPLTAGQIHSRVGDS